jgi:hypothetical protein
VLTLDRQTQDYCCCFRESNLLNPTHLPTQQNAGRRECSAAEQYTYLAARNTKHKRPRHLLYYNLLTTTKKPALLSHRVLLRTASEQANGNQIATYSLVCSAQEKRANERATSSCRASSSSADLPLSLSLPLCAAGAASEAPLLSSLPFPFVSFPSFLRSFPGSVTQLPATFPAPFSSVANELRRQPWIACVVTLLSFISADPSARHEKRT